MSKTPREKTTPKRGGHHRSGTRKKTRKNCGFHRHTQAIPPIIEQTCEYIERNALQHEGLFRISGSNQAIQHIKEKFERGKRVDLSKELNPNTVAGVLKLFFTELTEPIMTSELFPSFTMAVSCDNIPLSLWGVRQVMDVMPVGNRAVLARTMAMFATVAAFEENTKMNARNIALVMNPAMFRDSEESLTNFMRHGGARVRLIELIITHHEAIFKGSREELDESIRQHVQFTPEVEEHLIRFSQTLKRDSISLARSLVEEGETEMAVCFESFSDLPSHLDDWKQLDHHEQKTESDKPTRVDSDPLIRLRADFTSPRHRKRSSKSHPGREGSPNNSISDAPAVRGSVGTRWRKYRKTKQDSGDRTAGSSCLREDEFEFQVRENEGAGALSKRLSVDLISPRARPLLKVEKYHSTPVQFSSSVQLFFDPRSTEEIAKSWDIQPGKIFEMILRGDTEGVRNAFSPMSKDDRFLLAFRLQRAATDLIVTLNQAK